MSGRPSPYQAKALSALQRRILAEMVSECRDREPDPEFWVVTDVSTRTLAERLYVPGQGSYEIERRNQRQALGRSLRRLHARGLLSATALACVNVDDEAVLRWHGGGSRARKPGDVRGFDTPRWRFVSLSSDGLAVAHTLGYLDDDELGASGRP